VQVGGNASLAGHIKIGDGAKIAGMTGVMRDVEPMQVVAGIPSVPIKQWHRVNTALAKMVAIVKKGESE
jgi:UDP-3-O-[3-hydroxymyristoyl] glucosamine N-acyltransferase